MAIQTRLLPSAVAGTPYVALLDATGGTPSYSWAVSSGQLPAGVTLGSSSGVISGTPSSSGSYSVGLTLTDAAKPSNKKVSTVTISVAPPPLSMAPTTTLFATNGVPYSNALSVTGGKPGYIWSIASGSLPSGLSLAASTGILSGTPSASGIVSFTVAVRDSESPAKTQSSVVTMDIAAPQLKIAAPPSAPATVGTAFSETLQATGGNPSYRWSVAGNLPAGLTLNTSTGTITGVPSASGTASFTAMVNDSSSPAQAASASTAIIVAPSALTINAPSLPPVVAGTAYSQTLQVSGGTAPYRWSVTSGQLAPGLTLNSAGTISGTPTTSGNSSFTATVVDSGSPAQSASATTSVAVTATALVVTAPALPVRTVGAAYSQAFGVTGGTAPYTWRMTSGSLPAGLTLTPAGVVSGTAQASGTTNFTATVSDSSSPVQSASATAGITVAPTALVITSSSLAGVPVSSAYSQSLQASGGTAPYQWTITSGSLPAGLALVPSSGLINGTAGTTAGTANFTATVTDSSSPAQTASATESITIAPASLTITSATLAQATSGTAYLQTLQAAGGTGAYSWQITSGQLASGLSISASGVISGTPTTSTPSTFSVTVSDSGTPAQTQSATFTIAATAPVVPPLSIVSSTLAATTTGSSYSQTLQASGGTPGYTWSIASGTLPAGLTLASSTGVISGTPSGSGTATFTVAVSDNGNPTKSASASTSIAVTAPVVSAGTTWYIRTDGGTRYSANVPQGQCDGKTDAAYPGIGTNQPCAFKDFRYMWDDQSYGNDTWVMAGGDTVIIHGCAAASTQQNAVAPNCRIGWDASTGAGAGYTWCYGGNGSYPCSAPPVPSGTTTQPTRILGANYLNCSTGNAPDSTAVVQLVGGFSVLNVLNLTGSQNVVIGCVDITSHNGQCTIHGSPAYPRHCNTSYPLDDYDSNGIVTDNRTANILLQDVRVDGHTNSGIQGPIGGAITMRRVFVGFNGMAGWNFDDGSNTPNAAGASIDADYVTMEGNGCNQEYPIVHPNFPAKSCYDDGSGGFGDSWSGQDSPLASFICNHCVQMYNTKDGFIGPHTQITNLLIENSTAIGNMGQQWKWNNTTNAKTEFINNLTVGNCARMSQQLPGAAQNFALSTGLGGSYLSDFCRASGDTFSFSSQANSTVLIANNTVMSYSATVFDMNCGPAGGSAGTCGTTPFVYQNNIFLGYINPTLNPSYPQAPGLFYRSDSSDVVTANNNIQYGVRNGSTCGGNIICSDPLLTNEPQQTFTGETPFDNFVFTLTPSSPAINAGLTVSGITTDFNGIARPANPSIGALEP
ncbi:MAG TPA: putative Ig domain-containing protein [Acidobacteriaceae bacterium]|nr:putative Ig domain-containing protein [Acidobacteriaceae bacterium]